MITDRPARFHTRILDSYLMQRNLPAYPLLTRAKISKKQLLKIAESPVIYGDPDGIRTHDLQIRNLLLYPTELRDHINLYAPIYTRLFSAMPQIDDNFHIKL